MLRTDFTAGESIEPSHVVGVLGSTVEIPSARFLLGAEYERQGQDLRLVAEDGEILLIKGFFAGVFPPDLITNSGLLIKGGLAETLAGPLAPNQYAQFGPSPGAEPIGRVDTLEGTVTAKRATGLEVELSEGDPVFQGDVIETANDASIGITFADETTFSLGSEGQMVMDEMIYDPGSQEGSAAISILNGAFSFVSGQVAKVSPDAMTITTPVATIGIRGTAGGGQVFLPGATLSDGQTANGGETTAALLREIAGTGELTFDTGAGVRVLNQPNQATSGFSRNEAPIETFTMSARDIAQSFGGALQSNPAAERAFPPSFRQAVEKVSNEIQAQERLASAQARAEANEARAAELEAQAAAAETPEEQAAVAAELESLEAEAQALDAELSEATGLLEEASLAAEVAVALETVSAAEAGAQVSPDTLNQAAGVVEQNADTVNQLQQEQAQQEQAQQETRSNEQPINPLPEDPPPPPPNPVEPNPINEATVSPVPEPIPIVTPPLPDPAPQDPEPEPAPPVDEAQLPPQNSSPQVSDISLSATEDTDFTFSANSFLSGFSDGNGDPLSEVEIMTLPSIGGTLMYGGNAISAGHTIEAANLDSLVFTPTSDWTGTTSFSWRASDGKAFSNGDATATLSVSAVNDNPTLTSAPSSITVTTATASDADLSAATLADTDSTANTFTFTVAASAGTLTASSSGGVTVSGSGSASLTLTGTVSDIDTFLNTAANIQYTSAAGANGTGVATLTLSANDQDGSGNLSLGTVSVDANLPSGTYTINSGESLTITGNVTPTTIVNNGTLTMASGTVNTPSTITNNATLDFTGTNYTGTITNASGATYNMSGGQVAGTVTNSGTFNATGGSTTTGFVNNSVLDISSGVLFTGTYNTNPSFDSSSSIQGDGTFRTAGTSAWTYNAIWNPGTDGTVGALTMDTWDSNFGRTINMSSTTVYNVDIAGSTSGSYDTLHLSIHNSNSWAGTLNVNFISGYTPTAAATYDILTTGRTWTGYFDTITGLDANNGFILAPNYNTAGFKLTLTSYAVTHATPTAGTITGSSGADAVRSGASAETLDGGAGNDVLSGNDGADTLNGGQGADIMLGGNGSDIFLYTAANDYDGSTPDMILDFDATDSAEKISFQSLLVGTFSYVGTGAFTGTTNTEIRFTDSTKLLEVDLDGDAATDIEINLPGVSASDLDATDFSVT